MEARTNIESEMKEKIIKKIQEIESEKGIKVLLACETGSRGWGFPSPNSDYDIRLIYVHQRDWYISVSEKKDTIELMLEDGDLDITGWELRKTLRLLAKSNASLLERIHSPIVYLAEEVFVEEIKLLSQELYSPIATMHHYLSLAKKCMHDIEQEHEMKLKRFFYALRCSLACKWIMDKKSNPPLLFMKMVDELEFGLEIKNQIKELVVLKSQKNEEYLHEREDGLIQFMKGILKSAEQRFKDLKGARNKKMDLDSFLRRWVN